MLVDGVDINSIGLSKLRAAIAIIPQEPVLMAASIRYNLDPFEKKTDAEVRCLRLPISLLLNDTNILYFTV